MDDFAPVEWADLERVADRLFYNCPAVVADLEPTGDSPWHIVEPVYNTWQSEYSHEDDPDQGAVYLIAYLLERDGIVDVGLGERHPGPDRLETWFWEDRQTL